MAYNFFFYNFYLWDYTGFLNLYKKIKTVTTKKLQYGISGDTVLQLLECVPKFWLYKIF